MEYEGWREVSGGKREDQVEGRDEERREGAAEMVVILSVLHLARTCVSMTIYQFNQQQLSRSEV